MIVIFCLVRQKMQCVRFLVLLGAVSNLNHKFYDVQMILQIQLVIVPSSKEIMSFLAWYALLSNLMYACSVI